MPNKKVPVRNILENRNRAGSLAPNKSYSTSTDGSQVEGWWTEEEARLYETWAAAFSQTDTKFNNPYFDYFYTGQDISVSIEGLVDPEDKLYIYSFGYQIQQQKQPVYGFWSYTFDGMLRGTRLITGAFSLVVREPHELAKKIAKASHNRSLRANTSRGFNPINGLDEDEANIERYWRRNKDYNLEANQQHLFSIHPPFNMIIQYGLQTTSLSSTNPSMRSEDIRQFYKGKPPLHSDYNERLVPNVTPELDQRILLENIELTSKSLEYNVDGDPILENFTFMARDERIVPSKHIATTGPNSPNPGGRARIILS